MVESQSVQRTYGLLEPRIYCYHCKRRVQEGRSAFGVPLGRELYQSPEHYCLLCAKKLNVNKFVGSFEKKKGER